MFLSGFLGSSLGKSDSSRSGSHSNNTEASPSRHRSPSPGVSSFVYISEESQLRPVEPLPSQITDLNENLEVLATLFPDVQIEVFREMLTSFSDESRIEIVTDLLLRNPAAFVKGRRRATSASNSDQRPEKKHLVPRNEAFRGAGYKEAVRNLAQHEFKGLSRSTIDAVLSESNHSYLDARPTLVELSSKSWKFTISSILFRRKPVTSAEAETHPLIIWKSSGNGSIIPTIKSTGNAELDRELFQELVMPLKRREQDTREEKDRTLALALHTEEAEACEATYECGCCFTEATFEEFTTCNAEGHMVCFRCVQHSIKEAVFGQGWQRSIDKDSGTLLCPAVSASGCTGRIPSEHMQRAMLEEKKGFEILHKLDQRLAEHGLVASGLPLVRCPFCYYAEVDDIYIPSDAGRLRLRGLRTSNIFNILLALITVFLLPLCLLVPVALAVLLPLYCMPSLWDYASGHVSRALDRHRRRRRGLRFTCQNPACGRPSCMSCGKAWVDVHVCHESSLVALRTQVEQAMSLAVKRVCPRCGTSFVKAAGCNKLSCPCGYRMCYVCRADIGRDGYRHFCQHFRPEGDGSPCQECRRCNLWQSEDTDAVLRQAREDAERAWRESEARELSDAEKTYLQTAVGGGHRGQGHAAVPLGRLFPGGRVPSMEEFCDIVVEAFFV
ncbi:hypothetical protein DL769_011190 [Monosporascus sp. CRB-8-3]|nr:hypothetical protein DL769_011190 [Monosporascus sp. CRB-8-3]